MKTFAKSATLLFGIASSFTFGYYIKDIRGGVSDRNLLLGVRTMPATTKPEAVFQQSFVRILSAYQKPLARKDLKYSAMEGLVGSLGDPPSIFFVPKVNDSFRDETSGKFYGIGARLLPDPLGVKVTSVFTDGPAQKSGIKGEDVIIAVDGKSVAGMASDEIVLLIKGQENTVVNLRIMRPTRPEPIDFAIKREKVIPPLVESKVFKETNVGYLTIQSFSQEVPEQFEREWNAIDKANLSGLVIDLRGNPGGALDAVVEMLGKFVDDKLAVTLKGREGEEESTNTPSGQVKKINYKVAILMDEDSASAAEIMAGVLQDYGKAILVGEHSYGKFSVQTVFQQSDGAGIKLTIAKYFLPKQGALSRKVDEDGVYLSGGLKPDVFIEPDPDQEFESGNPAKDNQLAKAIEVVTKR